MVHSTQNVSGYRFGEFELDLRAAELRKNGVKLKLQEQPYQVLIKLLEHPGEVVSREDLRTTLWSQDTFVDFETGLNTAIKRLRETIGDSADHPAFIETVPRRGYKFIATVAPTVREDTRIPDLVSLKDSTPGKNRLNRNWAAAIIPALVLGSVAFWYRPAHPPTVAQTVRITNDFKPKSPGNATVTDGLYLYFIEGWPSTTGSRIAQLSIAGGETTWIATNLAGPEVIFSISPDRRELLVANGGGARLGEDEVWVQPLPAGTAHRVGNISASAAAWDPDGQHILYAGGGTINRVNKDGTESRVLTKVLGDARAFRFSPDGRRVRFWITQPKGESNSIWEMDADGKHLHPLFPNWKQASYQCCGSWSTNGEFYYFQASADNEEGIWVLPERTSIFSRAPASPSRLTTGALRFTSPLPSDDGKKLFVIGSEPRVELSRYDLHARRFDPYFSGLSVGPVDFSSDGKWIAYVSYPDMTLWRSRIDGTDKMQLTFPPVRVYEPRWSPDGSRIAFMDVRFNRPWKISLLSSSGGTPELLVHDSTDEADPTWTPDGESILFGKFDGTDKGTIYRLDLKSQKIFPIADSKGMFSPRLSRDGRYISAVTDEGSKLMLFETATNRWSSLMEGKELGYNEWSHDGKYVYLRQDRDGAGELVRVRIKDRHVEHLLSLKDFAQLSEDNVTGWIGLTPDDAPLLMRDRSVQELYALDLAFH